MSYVPWWVARLRKRRNDPEFLSLTRPLMTPEEEDHLAWVRHLVNDRPPGCLCPRCIEATDEAT